MVRKQTGGQVGFSSTEVNNSIKKMESDDMDRVPLMQNEEDEEETLWERKSKPFILRYIILIARLWGIATIAGNRNFLKSA